jgi:hypothetical protein
MYPVNFLVFLLCDYSIISMHFRIKIEKIEIVKKGKEKWKFFTSFDPESWARFGFALWSIAGSGSALWSETLLLTQANKNQKSRNICWFLWKCMLLLFQWSCAGPRRCAATPERQSSAAFWKMFVVVSVELCWTPALRGHTREAEWRYPTAHSMYLNPWMSKRKEICQSQID